MSHLYSKVGSTETLSSRIQSEIEKSILEKIFVPGDKLPTEKEMCVMFGVSRTALREALQMLSIQGLITIRKGSGIFVSEYNSANAVKPMSQYLQMNLDDELMLQVVEVRKMFEPQIAWMAACNRDDADVKLLEKNLSDLKMSDKIDYELQGGIDQNFHLKICESAKNPIIALLMDPILRLMPQIRTIVYSRIDTDISEAVEFHEQIYEAIRDQDADRARESMMCHLAVAENHLDIIINRRQENNS